MRGPFKESFLGANSKKKTPFRKGKRSRSGLGMTISARTRTRDEGKIRNQ